MINRIFALATAIAAVYLPVLSAAGGETVVFDAADTTENLTLRLDADGDLVLTEEGEVSLRRPLADVTSLRVNGNDLDNTLTVDFAGGNPIPPGGLTYDGINRGTDFDVLAFENLTVDSVVGDAFNLHDGDMTLRFAGGASSIIHYLNIEPITSTINATNVTLNFSTTAETLTVSDPGSNQTLVVSTAGESVQFNNPSGTLTINAGDTGSDTIDLESLPAGYLANLTLDGGGGGGTLNIKTALSFGAGETLTIRNLVFSANLGTAPGVVPVSANLVLGASTTAKFEIGGGTTPGTHHDQLAITGMVDLGGATLMLTGAGVALAAGQQIVLIDNDGTDPVTGTFDGLPEGGPVTQGAFAGQITYLGGDGNDVALIAPPAPPAEDVFEVVVLRGDPATASVPDGMASTATIYNINHAFLQNGPRTGVIYDASLLDAGANNAAVFVGPAGGPQGAIACRNAPSSLPGANYGLFSNLALNDAGDAGFQSLLATGAAHFLDGAPAGAPVAAAAVAGDPNYSVLHKPALSSGGALLSPASLRIGSGAPAVVAADDTLITSRDAGGAGIVAREGGLTSLPGGATTYGQIQPRVVASEAGARYAFASLIYDAAGFDPNTNTAVFSGAVGGAAPPVAIREGDPAPGTGGGVLANFLAESINSAGQLAVRASARGTGISSSNNDGVWIKDGSALSPVAREGDVAPVLPAGLVAFDYFKKIAMNDDGSVCFEAFLKDATTATPAVSSSNDQSLWRWDAAGGLRLIVREGDLAGGTDGAVVRTINGWASSGGGDVAYELSLLGGIGDTITTNNTAAYRQLDGVDPTARLVLRRGDVFELGGVETTVKGLKIDADANPVGGTGGYGRTINAAGEMLINLVLGEGQAGLFLLRPGSGG